MASVKDLRSKALSDMSADEINSYIDKAKKAGYTISESKDLGKAVELLKVMCPDKYGSEAVESAKTNLRQKTTLDTQQRLGFAPNPAGITPENSPFRTSGAGNFGDFGGGTDINLNEIYDSALNAPEFTALQDELTAKKKARDEAEAKINDNPYYTEATRVGRIAKLDEKALDEINTLQSQIDQKRADAQIRVNIASQQYNIEDTNYQRNLQKLNLLVDSGAILGASGSDISQIAVSTGLSTSMVSALRDKAAESEVSPHVVTSTDDYGNVTVSIVDLNTGDLIASNSLGAIGAGTSKSSGSGTGFDLDSFWNSLNSGNMGDIGSLWE